MTMMVASAGLEREVPGLPAPAPGVRRLGEQAADLVERPGIGRGCRSRVLADRRGEAWTTWRMSPVLGAADVFTVSSAFSILESIRLDLGYRMDVCP